MPRLPQMFVGITTKRRLIVPLAAIMFSLVSDMVVAQTTFSACSMVAPDGHAGNDHGASLAADAGILAVGAPNDNEQGSGSGAAYLYDLEGRTFLRKVLASDSLTGDRFGSSIGIQAGLLAVGAPLAGVPPNGSGNYGAAYLFDVSTGQQLRKFTPPDLRVDGQFGFAVALGSGFLAVSRPLYGTGSAVASVYVYSVATGVQLYRLDGTEFWFGSSLSIGDGLLCVGSYAESGGTGAVYVYDLASGDPVVRLEPQSDGIGGQFGWAVDAGDGLIAVGARRQGAVYLFETNAFTLIDRVLASDTQFHGLGKSVSLDAGFLTAGGNEFAVLFPESDLSQTTILRPTNQSRPRGFGEAVSIHRGAVSVGCPFFDVNGSPPGEVYLFDVPGYVCAADTNRDGLRDNGDIQTFVQRFLEQDCRADFNGDGFNDNGDIGAFVAAFLEGCP